MTKFLVPTITLHFDIVSPFAYLSFYALQNFEVFKKCHIQYFPIYLGGLMKLCDNRPPLIVKNKKEWINRERLQLAHKFDIPIVRSVPPGFPANTLKVGLFNDTSRKPKVSGTTPLSNKRNLYTQVQRILSALAEENNHQRYVSAINGLYKAYWVEGRDVTQLDVIQSVLSPLMESFEQLDGLLKKVDNDNKVKQLLERNTRACFDSGAFGLPWFEVRNANGQVEKFWGFDRLRQILLFLDMQVPQDTRWKALL